VLILVTGQPGNGKTLYTLGLVESLRTLPASVALGRSVYSSGIPDLTLDWKPLDDPALWHELPNGSIVVIDECQRVFPPRKQGAAVPPHVREFETHRHRGFDVFLITQHPQLLDIAVRKLVGRHVHLERRFGREVSTVKQWEECVNPQDRAVQSRALVSKFDFPKERYEWYKSADVHTVKKDFPIKPVAVLALSLLAIIGLGWFATSRLMAGKETEVAELLPEKTAALREAHATALSLEPDIPTWPWSAPFYRDVAKIVSYPRITGCMSMKIGETFQCTCHDGQGVAQVSAAICRDYLAGRYFDPTKPVEDKKAENIRRLDAGQSKDGRSGDDGGSTLTVPRQTEVAGRS